MFRKISLFVFLLFSMSSISLYAEGEGGSVKEAQIKVNDSRRAANEAQDALDSSFKPWEQSNLQQKATEAESIAQSAEKNLLNAKADAQKAAIDAAQKAHDEECAKSWDCIEKANFTINVDDISPGLKVNGKSSKETVNNSLGKIIQTLMVWLGSLSLLIMTIGAGYMVAYHGQDELLSKGKSIFSSWIIALVVALSSYIIVELVSGILF